jgi:hypothetical protein
MVISTTMFILVDGIFILVDLYQISTFPRMVMSHYDMKMLTSIICHMCHYG